MTCGLAGCSGGTDAASGSGSASGSEASVASDTATGATGAAAIDASALFSDRDLDPSYDEVTATITLSDAGCAVDGSGAQASGSEVTVTAAGTYVVSGALSDGRLVVDADGEKVQIVLDGASVTSSSATALYVRAADKVFLTLADGSENTLAATGVDATEDEHNLDGAVWAADDLTINGSGALAVTSAQGHGIVGKDELTLVSGEVSVTAAGHALQANDWVAVAGGTWELAAGTDGIHSAHDEDASLGFIYVGGGSIAIDAASDGLDAGGALVVDGGEIEVAAADDGLHAEWDLVVNGGTITVSESFEGLEGSTVTIAGGTIDITSSDDGINAAGEPDGTASDGADDATGDGDAHWPMDMGADEAFENDETAWVLISGGATTIDATGDGIDSNGDLTITGGETYVTGPTTGADGALDYGGDGAITGGTLVAVGASGMAQNLGESSTQVSLLVSASGSAGDAVTLADAEGTVLASFSPTRSYQCVVVSAPGMEVGETYTLTCGSSSVEVTADSVSVSQVGLGGVMGQAPGGGDMGADAPGAMGGEMGQAPGGDMGAMGDAPDAGMGEMGGGTPPDGTSA